MQRRRMFAWIAIVILLICLGGLLFWIASPRVLSTTPPSGSTGAAPAEPFVVEFSRAMDGGSIASRLLISPTVAVQVTVQGGRAQIAPQTPWRSGQRISIHLAPGARTESWPGLGSLQAYEWTFTVRPLMLAYLWPASGLANLYALSPTTGQVVQLTQGAGARDFDPSADGQWIYYTADTGDGGSQIMRISRQAQDSQAIKPEMVFDCPAATCRAPQVSPDSSRLAFERAPVGLNASAAEVAVWVLDLASRQAQSVAPAGETTRYPAWSQTGWLALYNATRQAYQLYPPGQGQPVSVANQLGDPGAWQPDGQVFVAAEYFEENLNLLDTTSSGHLLSYSSSAGGSFHDLTNANNIEDAMPVFSPDGKRLAFARKYLDPQRWTPGRQLWVMDATGGEARALSNDPFYNYYDMAWSPDGRQIAFVRFNQNVLTDPPELWLVNADGSDPIQLVIGGYAPAWIP